MPKSWTTPSSCRRRSCLRRSPTARYGASITSSPTTILPRPIEKRYYVSACGRGDTADQSRTFSNVLEAASRVMIKSDPRLLANQNVVLENRGLVWKLLRVIQSAQDEPRRAVRRLDHLLPDHHPATPSFDHQFDQFHHLLPQHHPATSKASADIDDVSRQTFRDRACRRARARVRERVGERENARFWLPVFPEGASWCCDIVTTLRDCSSLGPEVSNSRGHMMVSERCSRGSSCGGSAPPRHATIGRTSNRRVFLLFLVQSGRHQSADQYK
jgi:hypothetical protein